MNNTYRRIIVLMLVSVVFTLLTGAAVLAQETTITFLTPPWAVPPDADALAAFEAETGIAVEVQSVPLDQLYSQVQVAAGSGQSAADVIFLSEEAPSNVVATGNMLPLNDFIANTPELNIDDIERLDFWTVDGEVFGVTSYLQLVMMDYNAARLAEAGFDEAPTTWQELREQAVAVKEQGVEEFPIAMGAIDWSWYLIALSMGDPMFDEDLNPVFADEGSKAREALALLLSFFEDELISPEMLSGSSQHTLFWSGTGVFHQAWQGSVRVANNPAVSVQAPNVQYLLLPEEHNTWNFDSAIGISRDSEHPEEAWRFIQWYLGQQNQEDIFNAVGLVPSRQSAQQSLDEQGLVEGLDVILEQSEYVTPLPRHTLWWGPFTEAVSQSILEAANTGRPADEVIDALADEWDDLKAEFS